MHFEDIWNQSEQFCKNNCKEDSIDEILTAITMQISLYKTLSQKELPPIELHKMKTHLMGEILFMITKISLKDNINVFKALILALEEHKTTQLY